MNQVETRDLLDVLRIEVQWLVLIRRQYRELLIEAERSAVDLLTRHLGFFATCVRRGLERDMIMTVARLSYSTGEGGKANLVLRRGLEALPSSHARCVELSERFNRFESHCDPIRKSRHKLFGHSDLNVALGVASPPFVDWPTLFEAIDQARDLINAVLDACEREQTVTESGMVCGGAKDLHYVLSRFNECLFYSCPNARAGDGPKPQGHA